MTRTAPGGRAHPDEEPMRLLLVDDEEQVIKAYLRLLRRRPGMDAVGVFGAGAALDELSHAPFDCVVVDHHLAAGESGITLLREVERRWPATRRILCTGGTIADDEAHHTAGAHAVLYKPADVEELLAVVGYDEESEAAALRAHVA